MNTTDRNMRNDMKVISYVNIVKVKINAHLAHTLKDESFKKQ